MLVVRLPLAFRATAPPVPPVLARTLPFYADGPLMLKTVVRLTPPLNVLVTSGPTALNRPTDVLLCMELGTGMSMVSLLVATPMLL